jgi:hypothetical protein
LRGLGVLRGKTPRHRSDDVFGRRRGRRRDSVVGSHLGNGLLPSFGSLGLCLLDLSERRSGWSLDLFVVLDSPWGRLRGVCGSFRSSDGGSEYGLLGYGLLPDSGGLGWSRSSRGRGLRNCGGGWKRDVV